VSLPTVQAIPVGINLIGVLMLRLGLVVHKSISLSKAVCLTLLLIPMVLVLTLSLPFPCPAEVM